MCWKCGLPGEISKPGFRDVCQKCGKDLHACKNCLFFEPGAYRDCRETVPDGVTDKERGNFCEYFQLNPSVFSASGGSPGKKGPNSKSEFDKLFGG